MRQSGGLQGVEVWECGTMRQSGGLWRGSAEALRVGPVRQSGGLQGRSGWVGGSVGGGVVWKCGGVHV